MYTSLHSYSVYACMYVCVYLAIEQNYQLLIKYQNDKIFNIRKKVASETYRLQKFAYGCAL